MTGEELVEMWREESNAANDCIIEILESYMEFAALVEEHADGLLQLTATFCKREWTPILEHAKEAKKKGSV